MHVQCGMHLLSLARRSLGCKVEKGQKECAKTDALAQRLMSSLATTGLLLPPAAHARRSLQINPRFRVRQRGGKFGAPAYDTFPPPFGHALSDAGVVLEGALYGTSSPSQDRTIHFAPHLPFSKR